jgi:hypothetical protein
MNDAAETDPRVVLSVRSEIRYTAVEATGLIEVTDADIRECRDCASDPYTGSSDQDFIEYVHDVCSKLQDEAAEASDYPDIIRDLFLQLYDFPCRREVWNSNHKHEDSLLRGFDASGQESASTGSW